MVVYSTLKHSGSLVMLCCRHGKPFFFAKNSVDNMFTAVAQFLLPRQLGQVEFDDMIRVLGEMNLCIGFEVVAKHILGDHGDVPVLHYCVPTSVMRLGEASKCDGSPFFNMENLLDFCLQHGLLWNEMFVCDDPELLREFVGDDFAAASDYDEAVAKLRKFSTAIPAVSHKDLQGPVLEGVVVHTSATRTISPRLEELALAAISPTLAAVRRASHELDDWLATHRQLSTPTSFVREFKDAVPTINDFVEGNPQDPFAVLLSFCRHELRVAMKGFRFASEPGHGGHEGHDALVVILHGLQDSTFAKFRRDRPAGCAPLFRGHSLLIENGKVSCFSGFYPKFQNASEEGAVSWEDILADFDGVKGLRLKSKLISYTKKTFIARNSLATTLARGGSFADYEAKVRRYLLQWNAPEALAAEIATAMRGWGHWCLSRMFMNDALRDRLSQGLYLEEWARFEQHVAAHGFPIPTDYRGILIVAHHGTPLEKSPANKFVADHPGLGALPSAKELGKPTTATRMLAAVEDSTFFQAMCTSAAPGKLEEALKPHAPRIVVVDEEGEAIVNEKDKRKADALLPKWKFLDLFPHAASIGEAIEMLKHAAPPPLPPPKRALVIFAGMPGMGKSYYEALANAIAALTGFKNVVFFDGDSLLFVKVKYWRHVYDTLANVPPGEDLLLIAAKNCPPPLEGGANCKHWESIAASLPAGTKVIVAGPGGHEQQPMKPCFTTAERLLCMHRVFTRGEHPNLKGPKAPAVVCFFNNLYRHLTWGDLQAAAHRIFGPGSYLPIDFANNRELPHHMVHSLEIFTKLSLSDVHDEAITEGFLKMLQTEADFMEDELTVRDFDFPRSLAGALDGLKAREAAAAAAGPATTVFVELEPRATEMVSTPKKTLHCTLGYGSDAVTDNMRALVGSEVTVTVDSEITSNDSHLSALQVVSILRRRTGEEVKSANDWPHVTTLNPAGAAKDANMLPEMERQGQAQRRKIDPALVFSGIVREERV